jgi:hypothetical protein
MVDYLIQLAPAGIGRQRPCQPVQDPTARPRSGMSVCDIVLIFASIVLLCTAVYCRDAWPGLLVWGNGRKQQQKILNNLPVGPNSATIVVGDECLGGCKVHLVLSLPRPAADSAAQIKNTIGPLLLQVPTSKLFDVLAPATDYDEVTLNVVEDNRLNVSVRVVPAEPANAGMPPGLFAAAHQTPDGKLVPVMRSNTEAEIEVKVGFQGCALPFFNTSTRFRAQCCTCTGRLCLKCWCSCEQHCMHLRLVSCCAGDRLCHWEACC